MEALPLVISSGWAAGVNAYATVLLLGVFGRLGLGDVPDGLENPGVMAAAAALYAVEFVTDKIPYVDNVWDTVHTAIRPTIAAVLGVLLAGDATGLEDALAAVGLRGDRAREPRGQGGAASGDQPLPRSRQHRNREPHRGRPGRRGRRARRHPPVGSARPFAHAAGDRAHPDRPAVAGYSGAIRWFVSA